MNILKRTMWIKFILIHLLCMVISSILIGLYVVGLNPVASEFEMIKKINSLSMNMMILNWILTLVLCFFVVRKNKKRVYFSFKVNGYSILLVLLIAISFVFIQLGIWNIGYSIVLNMDINDALLLFEEESVINLIFVVILIPLAEEIFFRGFLLESLIDKTKLIVALIIQGLAFSFFQGGLIISIYSFLLSLVLGYIYFKTKNLLTPILCRLFLNVFSFVFMNSLLNMNNSFINILAISGVIVIVSCLITFKKENPRMIN